MARKKKTARQKAAPRKKTPVRKPTPTVDDGLQAEAEHILGTIRGMKDSLRNEADPAQREHTIRLLRAARRKFARFRKSLEILQDHPQLGPGIRDQINLFLLIEHECRVEEQGSTPV